MLQIRGPVLLWWRPDGDEEHVAVAHGVLQRRREFQSTFPGVGRDDILQPRFVDRNATRQQCRDLGFVLVDADDPVPHLGETGAGDKTDVAGPDDT